MEAISNFVNDINGLVWGPPMLVMILGVGLFLSIGLKLMPIMKLGAGFRLMWSGRAQGDDDDGDIPPFQALMTALSATVGTGNIAGVATAVFLGGPGALFWMWLTALVGMATKYGEAVLAVRYREVDERGAHVGGPMYYIRNGLGKKWAWLGVLFAIFASIAAFGIGNTVQANSVADVLSANFGLPHWITGVLLMIMVGLVLIGGIKRIGQVASALVPFMAVSYVLVGLLVLAINANEIPAAISMVFSYAFSPAAAEGGFAGAAVWAAIRFGVARGIFSNEAGLGSAPIAHASAHTDHPARQGSIAMLGTFIDTIVVCSVTGLAIVATGAWTSGEEGAPLSALAFSSTFGTLGNAVVACGLAVFAFTTLLGWSLYSERCTQYLFGDKALLPFRIVWVLVVPVGAIVGLDLVWALADIMNILMAVPNLIALLLLAPVVVRLSNEFFKTNG